MNASVPAPKIEGIDDLFARVIEEIKTTAKASLLDARETYVGSAIQARHAAAQARAWAERCEGNAVLADQVVAEIDARLAGL